MRDSRRKHEYLDKLTENCDDGADGDESDNHFSLKISTFLLILIVILLHWFITMTHGTFLSTPT